MTHTIEIVSFTRREKTRQDKNVELGFFDVTVGGLRLNGCLLVQYPNGTVATWPPRILGERAFRVGVSFTDITLLANVTEAAHAVYLTLGGSHLSQKKAKLTAVKSSGDAGLPEFFRHAFFSYFADKDVAEFEQPATDESAAERQALLSWLKPTP